MLRHALYLAGFGSGVAALFGAWVWEAPRTPVAASFTFASLAGPAQPSDVAPSEASGADIEARPLFHADRRPIPKEVPADAAIEAEPAPPEAVETPVAAVERPSMKLLGTERSAREPAALIVNEDNDDSLWVREGDVVSGWRVARIEAEEIALVRDTGETSEVVLSLYPDSR